MSALPGLLRDISFAGRLSRAIPVETTQVSLTEAQKIIAGNGMEEQRSRVVSRLRFTRYCNPLSPSNRLSHTVHRDKVDTNLEIHLNNSVESQTGGS